MGGGSGRPLFGILSAYFVACGARDPRTPSVQGSFLLGRGRFCCPLTGPFHTAFFTRPVFFFSAPGFFFAFEATPCWMSFDAMQAMSCLNVPEIPRAALRMPETLKPLLKLSPNPVLWTFSYAPRGKCCPFFPGVFFGDFPNHFGVFSEFYPS